MNEKKFYTKRGELTSYALACGYIQTHEHLQQKVTLWYEMGVYHVRRFNHFRGVRVCWNTFDTLTDARIEYDKQVKEVDSLAFIPVNC